MPTLKYPADGIFGIQWSRLPEGCLRPFVDEDYRKATRLRERELSAWDMVLRGEISPPMPVQCLDASATGFRLKAEKASPVPSPGSIWSLELRENRRILTAVPLRMVWSQKRASEISWEAGFERLDFVSHPTLLARFPEPGLAFDTPGSGLIAYLSHPLLFQEWMRLEVARITSQGDLILIAHHPSALAFRGKPVQLRLALPNMATFLFTFSISLMAQTHHGLVLYGRLGNEKKWGFPSRFKSRQGRALAAGLLQAGLFDVKALKLAGFPLQALDAPVDVQGLAIGKDSQRRVLGAFLEGKLVASLAYCLDNSCTPPQLRVEGLSLQIEALHRQDIPDRLFGMVGRALILSPYSHLRARADESQQSHYLGGGFLEEKSEGKPESRFLLSRGQILLGWGMPWRIWWRCYRPMVADLIDKGLLPTSHWHRLWIRLCGLAPARKVPWP